MWQAHWNEIEAPGLCWAGALGILGTLMLIVLYLVYYGSLGFEVILCISMKVSKV